MFIKGLFSYTAVNLFLFSLFLFITPPYLGLMNFTLLIFLYSLLIYSFLLGLNEIAEGKSIGPENMLAKLFLFGKKEYRHSFIVFSGVVLSLFFLILTSLDSDTISKILSKKSFFDKIYFNFVLVMIWISAIIFFGEIKMVFLLQFNKKISYSDAFRLYVSHRNKNQLSERKITLIN